MNAGGRATHGAVADDCMDRYIAPAISAFTTSMCFMQEVDRKLPLRFLHSPHPCGLATPPQGWSMDRSVADDCMDAGGRATQEQLPRTQMTLIVIPKGHK